MKILNEQELTMLKELSTRKGVKGQAMLKSIIWLNTVEPKYKIDDTVKYRHANDTLLFGKVDSIMLDTTSKKVSYGIISEIQFEDTEGNFVDKQTKKLTVSEFDILFTASDCHKLNIVVMEVK